MACAVSYLTAHVATGHVREDGLQHHLHRGGSLTQRGQDGEEAVPDRDGIQTTMEVLMFGQMKPTST